MRYIRCCRARSMRSEVAELQTVRHLARRLSASGGAAAAFRSSDAGRLGAPERGEADGREDGAQTTSLKLSTASTLDLYLDSCFSCCPCKSPADGTQTITNTLGVNRFATISPRSSKSSLAASSASPEVARTSTQVPSGTLSIGA